jgi:hypothetical protein
MMVEAAFAAFISASDKTVTAFFEMRPKQASDCA